MPPLKLQRSYLHRIPWRLAAIWLLICSPATSGAAEPESDAPLPPLEAARTMVVPPGFHVTLFAGEPDVKQPIGFCLDDRGRLWVAEAYNYPNHGDRPGDRILIFEDVDGDGRFDKRTVFYDKLNYVTGVEVGFGGVWVMSPPNFYFIPDRDQNDIPDGEPQVLLDGFGNHANAHNLANGFAWGPDGWLYGTHGRTNWSMLGKPGTPNDQRVRFDGGVYRYHPVRHVWEPYADGTTNPWGIDWDDYGEGFVCNCVNPHLFHVIQGAHYEPWRNLKSSQYAYQRLSTIADHLHFVGGGDVRAGLNTAEEDEAGGGHAHCGTMVYLGDNWPDSYRNTVFMNNIHGHRINNDILRRVGSGYVASHGRDVMVSKDDWYVGVTLQYGPDGAVYASDWSDTGECHSVKNTRRHTGRIFKITYGKPAAAQLDLARLDDQQLVQLQLHRNDWYVRHARRLLQQRAAAGREMTKVHESLHAIFAADPATPRKLRALWALHVTGGLDSTFLLQQLEHSSQYVRAWAVRLLCQDGSPPAEAFERFRGMARHDDSAYVRLHLASALQRLPLERRWAIAAALAARGEDKDDANLPLMIWYGVLPLAEQDAARFVDLAKSAQLPLIRRHVARRAASLPEEQGLALLVQQLAFSDDHEACNDLLTGILQGLEGRRRVAAPPAWRETYSRLMRSPLATVREQAIRLALQFDDPVAQQHLRQQAADRQTAPDDRNRALQALVAKRVGDLETLLLKLAADPVTQRTALRGLAQYNHPDTAQAILAQYASLNDAAKQDALQTLASRGVWAKAMLEAVAAQRIPRTDLSAYTARQLLSLRDPSVTALVKRLWGEVRTSPADRAQLAAQWKRRLTPAELERADLSAGRETFSKNCASCHRLFGEGGQIGPDLTGSQRQNLDYLLENLADPSAAVSKDFQMQVIETAAGRVISGLVVEETRQALTVQTVNEKVVIPREEVERSDLSPLSLMPDGLLQKLSSPQVRDLIAYLRSAAQVPLPPSTADASLEER